MNYIPLVFTALFFMALVKDAAGSGFRKRNDRQFLGLVGIATLSWFCGQTAAAVDRWLVLLVTSIGLAVLMHYCLAWGREHWLQSGTGVSLQLNGRALSKHLVPALAGALVGTAYSLLVYRICGITLGTVQRGTDVRQGIALFVGSLGVVIAEEIASRYYLQGYLTQMLRHVRWKRHVGCAVAAVAFTALHVDRDHQIVRWLQVFPLGLFFGYLFLRGGLLFSVSVHWQINLGVYICIWLKAGTPS